METGIIESVPVRWNRLRVVAGILTLLSIVTLLSSTHLLGVGFQGLSGIYGSLSVLGSLLSVVPFIVGAIFFAATPLARRPSWQLISGTIFLVLVSLADLVPMLIASGGLAPAAIGFSSSLDFLLRMLGFVGPVFYASVMAWDCGLARASSRQATGSLGSLPTRRPSAAFYTPLIFLWCGLWLYFGHTGGWLTLFLIIFSGLPMLLLVVISLILLYSLQSGVTGKKSFWFSQLCLVLMAVSAPVFAFFVVDGGDVGPDPAASESFGFSMEASEDLSMLMLVIFFTAASAYLVALSWVAARFRVQNQTSVKAGKGDVTRADAR